VVQQAFWCVPEAQSAGPFYKWKSPAVPKDETVGALKPLARMFLDAIHDFGDSDDATDL